MWVNTCPARLAVLPFRQIEWGATAGAESRNELARHRFRSALPATASAQEPLPVEPDGARDPLLPAAAARRGVVSRTVSSPRLGAGQYRHPVRAVGIRDGVGDCVPVRAPRRAGASTRWRRSCGAKPVRCGGCDAPRAIEDARSARAVVAAGIHAAAVRPDFHVGRSPRAKRCFAYYARLAPLLRLSRCCRRRMRMRCSAAARCRSDSAGSRSRCSPRSSRSRCT